MKGGGGDELSRYAPCMPAWRSSALRTPDRQFWLSGAEANVVTGLGWARRRRLAVSRNPPAGTAPALPDPLHPAGGPAKQKGRIVLPV
jgi:hypothetical protein